MDEEGKAITTSTGARWVQHRVATHGEVRDAECECGLKPVKQMDLGRVVHRSLAHVGVWCEAHH